jgi:hypothetical protein
MSYYDNIPQHTEEALMNYFNHCWEPGSFLMSVLTNDLYGAASRADTVNRPELAKITVWVINNAPYGSYGDHETVKNWLNKGHYQQVYEKQRLIKILSTE